VTATPPRFGPAVHTHTSADRQLKAVTFAVGQS
jgi:hypothetical protein